MRDVLLIFRERNYTWEYNNSPEKWKIEFGKGKWMFLYNRNWKVYAKMEFFNYRVVKRWRWKTYLVIQAELEKEYYSEVALAKASGLNDRNATVIAAVQTWNDLVVH